MFKNNIAIELFAAWNEKPVTDLCISGSESDFKCVSKKTAKWDVSYKTVNSYTYKKKQQLQLQLQYIHKLHTACV